jgi:ABC-2 type transport system ATP-binding protein
MIEIKNLTKRYGDKTAVDNVSFTVNDGEILGFLGPNGAGKSTTMNILTGYLSATEGQCIIGGHDILEEPTEAKKKIGYLPEHPPLYMDMTVDEYLSFMYDLKKVKVRASKKAHISAICDLVRITEVRGRVIKHLSKGYKQRVGIAQALLGNPEVLILDEPTVGLDPKQIIEIRTLIENLSQNHTVILSSHILSEIQAVCDRVIVISRGKIVADDTEENLSNRLSKDFRYEIRVEGPRKEVQQLLETMPQMKEVLFNGEKEKGVFEFQVEAKGNIDIRREMIKRINERGWMILGLRSSAMTLEDIFLQLTNDTYADEKVPVEPETEAAEAELGVEESVEEVFSAMEEAAVEESVPVDASAEDNKEEES